MRKIILPALLLVFSLSIINAQEKTYEAKEIIITEEANPVFKDSLVNAFVLQIPQIKMKPVKKDWINFIEKGTKSTAVVEGEKIIITDAKKERLSINPVHIYSQLTESGDGVKMYVSFLVDSIYLKSETNGATSEVAKKMLHEFAIEQYKDAVKNELEGENKTLDKLKDQLESLQSSNKKMKKEISYNESKIEANKQEAEVNKASEEKVQEEYAKQKSTLTLLDKKTDAGKAQTKVVKDLESQKNKLLKANERLSSDSIDREENIKQITHKIGENDKEQEDMQTKIDAQKEVVKKVEKKLSDIK